MLAGRLRTIRERIESATTRCGRAASEVKLLAVSKTHPAESVRDAIDRGLTAFGENKIREAAEKIPCVGRDGIEWHLIGHLQSNKARRAVQLFDVIHTLDSIDLAKRLERICIEEGRDSLSVLIQMDLASEATKSGIAESDLPELLDHLKRCERLKLTGFMILPPFFDDAEITRPYFRHLREIRDRSLPGGELSMGMSHDLEVAIEEGSTIIRVGTAIFGRRN